MLLLSAKKTNAREVELTDQVIKAVKDYQDSEDAKDDEIMFEPGPAFNPAGRWSNYLKRFF